MVDGNYSLRVSSRMRSVLRRHSRTALLPHHQRFVGAPPLLRSAPFLISAITSSNINHIKTKLFAGINRIAFGKNRLQTFRHTSQCGSNSNDDDNRIQDCKKSHLHCNCVVNLLYMQLLVLRIFKIMLITHSHGSTRVF